MNDHAANLAFEEWALAIGTDHVDLSDVGKARVATTTFATTQQVRAVLRPGTTSEVQECVRIANRHKIPLYAVSGGKNWGLGSRVPVADESVVLDLARLDKIVRYDDKFGCLTVQPGVTFEQAWNYLVARGSSFHLSPIGGSKRASVVGNLLERGHGFGPLADRAAHACDFEVVLASGEVIHTGFRRVEGARVHGLHRWGVGPAVDGLFLQSNMGVVTEVTLWLLPRAKYSERIFVRVDETKLCALIDAVQPLKWDDAIELLFSNRIKLWGFGLSAEEAGLPGWCGIINVFAESELELRGRTHRAFLALDDVVSEAFIREDDLATHVPTDGSVEYMLSLAKSKKRESKGDPELDDERCGLLWCCPTLPFSGEDVERFRTMVAELSTAHGFDFMVTLRPMQARSIDVVLLLAYDRDTEGADDRAMACYRDVNRRMTEAGYPPYRLGIQSMNDPINSEVGYPQLIRTLKLALDPNDILSPGRYDWRDR